MNCDNAKFIFFFFIIFLCANFAVCNELEDYVEKSVNSETKLHKLADFAIDWAHNNGLILRTKQFLNKSDVAEFAPVSLLPSPFPRHAFEKAVAVHEANAREMEARRTIELSNAIKAPSLAIAISSSKKIQQLLTTPGTLERFFPSATEADKVAAIRETFTGLWGLEKSDDQTERRIKDAIENPANYVLKSNGECGGNNFYDEALAEKLRTMPQAERASHILMQKLIPMATKNYFLRPFHEPKLNVVVGELGVNGTLLGNLHDQSVQHNVQSGHLLRTKLREANEGGISVGTGVGDSPYLF
uniref:Glutathione synthetase n=1 Tax=Globodera pallida TaxID=36090 RepID=A0A183CD52_GLOPA